MKKNKGTILTGIKIVDYVDIMEFLPLGSEIKMIEPPEDMREGRVTSAENVFLKIKAR